MEFFAVLAGLGDSLLFERRDVAVLTVAGIFRRSWSSAGSYNLLVPRTMEG